MNRDLQMTITLSKEKEEDFRLFIVLNGGSIKDCRTISSEEE